MEADWLQFVDQILQGLRVVNCYFEVVVGWRLIDLNRDACGREQLPILSEIRSAKSAKDRDHLVLFDTRSDPLQRSFQKKKYKTAIALHNRSDRWSILK
jgi:hypothetical protein